MSSVGAVRGCCYCEIGLVFLACLLAIFLCLPTLSYLPSLFVWHRTRSGYVAWSTFPASLTSAHAPPGLLSRSFHLRSQSVIGGSAVCVLICGGKGAGLTGGDLAGDLVGLRCVVVDHSWLNSWLTAMIFFLCEKFASLPVDALVFYSCLTAGSTGEGMLMASREAYRPRPRRRSFMIDDDPCVIVDCPMCKYSL